MRGILCVSMLLYVAISCSCQKQDATAEAELAQRKTELDAREERLAQRENVVDAREKAVAERERAVAGREKAVAKNLVVQPQRQAPDAAQAEAERQRRIQQLPPELRALIPDRSRMDPKAEKDRAAQQRAVKQPGLEEIQRKKMYGTIVSPDAQPSEPDTTSPSASPTPR